MSSWPGVLNLEVYGGDTYTNQIEFVDPDGDPIDMTGAWTYSAIWRGLGGRSQAFTVDVTDAADGLIVLRLSSTETTGIAHGGRWDLQRSIAGTPPVVETLLAGVVEYREGVT